MENPIKMDDLGVPLFSETSIATGAEFLPSTVGLGKNGDFGGVTFVDPKFDPGGFFQIPQKKNARGPGGSSKI